jgi:hypothetical protein
MRVTPDYDAVRHILASPLIADRCAPYIETDDFDWTGLLAEAETMSGGGKLLVRIAYDLWTAAGVVGIWELPRRLDDSNFARVIAAFEVARGAAATGEARVAA